MVDLFVLLFIVISVQTVWATMIRPHAEAIRAADLERMMHDKDYVPKVSPFVIVKDPEQETCFIFAIWAITTMVIKGIGVNRGRRLLGGDLLHLPDGMKILPEDTREYARQIEALPEPVRTQLLPRARLSPNSHDRGPVPARPPPPIATRIADADSAIARSAAARPGSTTPARKSKRPASLPAS